jgi:hypothetical protein
MAVILISTSNESVIFANRESKYIHVDRCAFEDDRESIIFTKPSRPP